MGQITDGDLPNPNNLQTYFLQKSQRMWDDTWTTVCCACATVVISSSPGPTAATQGHVLRIEVYWEHNVTSEPLLDGCAGAVRPLLAASSHMQSATWTSHSIQTVLHSALANVCFIAPVSHHCFLQISKGSINFTTYAPFANRGLCNKRMKPIPRPFFKKVYTETCSDVQMLWGEYQSWSNGGKTFKPVSRL